MVVGQDDDVSGSGHGPVRRRRKLVGGLVAGLIVIGLGLGLGLGLSGGGSPAPTSPEGVALQQVPDLAPVSTSSPGTPVDGITCRTTTQQKVTYHIHVHVAIFVNGRQERIPAGVGIAPPRYYEHLSTGLFIDNSVNGCLYWLHIHANDGVIHVESPTVHVFTLGQFFDIWRQPLGSGQVGPAKGPVVAFENGKRFTGNPRNIPLLRHAVIQLDVGSPVVAFRPVHFTVNGLCGSGTQGCATGAGG